MVCIFRLLLIQKGSFRSKISEIVDHCDFVVIDVIIVAVVEEQSPDHLVSADCLNYRVVDHY